MVQWKIKEQRYRDHLQENIDLVRLSVVKEPNPFVNGVVNDGHLLGVVFVNKFQKWYLNYVKVVFVTIAN